MHFGILCKSVFCTVLLLHVVCVDFLRSIFFCSPIISNRSVGNCTPMMFVCVPMCACQYINYCAFFHPSFIQNKKKNIIDLSFYICFVRMCVLLYFIFSRRSIVITLSQVFFLLFSLFVLISIHLIHINVCVFESVCLANQIIQK